MSFPVYLRLGPVSIHPHWVFESLAYLVGFRVYLQLRKAQGDALNDETRGWVIAAAILGAALGSKLLFWLADPLLAFERRHDAVYLMSGKSIVGALAGGVMAVEGAKRWLGIHRKTGDLFALPLAVGLAIGRVGCFLSGLDDHTHGLPTRLAWGIDLGDGVMRHPTTLYESGFALLLALALHRFSRLPHREGDVFKVFMIGYMGFRLALEFIKPRILFAGLSSIQWVCLAALFYYRKDIARLLRRESAVSDG